MKVKLGDVVNKVVENADRLNTDLVYYIGGEHINSESLCIYSGGLLDSDKGKTLGYQFQFRFQKDDVLFMTKNPYLKKCAKVCFDGICSIATFVLRTKDDGVLLQYFLPVLLQTSDFWNYLEANKSGSVNYFITWKTLSAYEFKLPTIEEQRRIADLAWSIERTKVAYEKLLRATDELVKSQFIEMFDTGKHPSVKLKTVCTKITDGTHKTPHYLNEGITFVSAKNIINYELDFTDVKYISKEEYEEIQKRCQVEVADILLSKSGSLGSPVILRTNQPLGLFESLAVIKYDRTQLVPEFLCEQLKSERIQLQFKNGTRGVAVKHLHLNVIGDIEIVLPPLDLQKQFAAFVRQTDKSKFELTQALEALNATYKKLISENLG